jgi:acyl phosphate:glycerol-3-phosphate acyltransferase
MISFESIVALILAYLLGSIPSAVWIGQAMYGIDVREYGSGNSGATNTFRVLGVKAGIPVLLIDIFKGWIAVKLGWAFGEFQIDTAQYHNLQLSLAIAALIGHIFPVYVGFRGGKGVATLLGIILAVHVHAALYCMAIFIVLLLITRYVSLSSMITGIAFPFIIMLGYSNTVVAINIFGMFVSILILVTHQKNIERLLRGEEKRLSFARRGKEEEE